MARRSSTLTLAGLMVLMFSPLAGVDPRGGASHRTGAESRRPSRSCKNNVRYHVRRVARPCPVIGVVRDGRVHELRGEGLGAIADFIRPPLLSTRSKLTLAKLGPDLLKARKGASYERHDLRATLD